MSEPKVRPLFDRLLVQRMEPKEVVKGGIVLPDTAKEKPLEGRIVSVGPGKRNDEGEFIDPVVKPGDRVLIGKYSGTEVVIDDEEYVIIREDDVLAVLE